MFLIVEIITTDSRTEQKLITNLGQNFHQVWPPKGMSLLPFRLFISFLSYFPPFIPLFSVLSFT